MAAVTIHHAKTNLSKPSARAETGEEIVIARGRQPIAKLIPVAEPKRKARARPAQGHHQHSRSVAFDPLPEQELRLWEGLPQWR